MRVSVVVVHTDGDHRRGRADGVEEAAGVGVAAVMGHLHHVGAQPVGLAEQTPLRGLLGVAGQEQPAGVRRDAQHDGVGIVVGAEGAVGRRAQDLHQSGAERESVAGADRHDRDVCSFGGRVALQHRGRQVLAVRLGGDWPDQERADVEGRQDRGQPGDVIVVRMAHDRRIEAPDTAPA